MVPNTTELNGPAGLDMARTNSVPMSANSALTRRTRGSVLSAVIAELELVVLIAPIAGADLDGALAFVPA